MLPQITNVSRFWRLSAAAMIRRRKRDFGEPIVPCTLKTVSAPMGVAQHALYTHWLSKSRFASFYTWKYPEHPLVESGQIERFAAACGQLTKLEYATTAPEAATDRDWPGLTGLEHSNWTPKNMKTLELILQHVKAGEKILVGSDLIETGRWLCDRLLEKGVRAGHIVEERNGKPATVNPKKRAVVMRDFRHGSLQVLLCGIPAIRLGHNLDTASVVVVDGLVFSYEMFDQGCESMQRINISRRIGGLPVTEVETAHIDRLASEMLKDGSAPKTVRNVLSFLHSIFEHAKRKKLISDNPVSEATRPGRQRTGDADPDLQFLTVAELDAVLRAIPDEVVIREPKPTRRGRRGPAPPPPPDVLGPVLRVVILAAAMTGLRQSELLGLRWRHVDWVAQRIRVRNTYVRGEHSGDGKSDLSTKRSVPMADRLAGELDRWSKRTAYRGERDLVFGHPQTGNPLDRSKVTKRFQTACGDASVQVITFHDLRHTFATRLAASGQPLRLIQEFMGHADSETTQIYSHYAPSEHEVQVVNDAFAPAPAREPERDPQAADPRGQAEAGDPLETEAPSGTEEATGNNPGNKLSESESN